MENEQTDPSTVDQLSPEADSSSSKDENKIVELEDELKKSKNKYLYLRAEFDNYKKQMLKERSALLKYSGEKFFTELLEIVDNFERAFEVQLSDKNTKVLEEGMKLIYLDVKSFLDRSGVQEVPCKGEKFDPLYHAAIGSEETTDFEPGYISQVFKKPYKLHDKLIRPGQVIVAKAPSKDSE